MRRALQAIAVMVPALLAWNGAAQAQAAQSDTIRVLIRQMLSQSPLLRDSITVVEDANYTLRARDLLSLIMSPDSTVRIRTALDAVQFLERMLVPDTVLVRLESDPPGFTVRYYRIGTGVEAWLTATTDTILRVPAGLYRFRFLNSATGEMRTQGRSCVTDCRLRWRY